MGSQVTDLLVGVDVDHHSADRHGNHLVLATLAVHLPAHAVLAALRLEAALMTEVNQGVQVFIGHQPDTAAIAAITTVRPAQRNELLATEADAAVAAITGDDLDFCLVYKFHDPLDCLVRTGLDGRPRESVANLAQAPGGRWRPGISRSNENPAEAGLFSALQHLAGAARRHVR